MSSPSHIHITGAHQNNLKNIDVQIPIGQFTVVTGPSGSGKSSFAFDTVYAEGQRRYVETFSPYTRQFFERMDKPKVTSITGIPPAIAIEQVNQVRSSRSNVGSITEIQDYLKLLFPRLCDTYCPECQAIITPLTVDDIAKIIFEKYKDHSVLIGFEFEIPADTSAKDLFPLLTSQAYLRVVLANAIIRTDEPQNYNQHQLPQRLFVIQDRLQLSTTSQNRLIESIEKASVPGKGSITLYSEKPLQHLQRFSLGWHCSSCDIPIQAPSPHLFNYNNPLGACPDCKGFGKILELDYAKIIPNRLLSINQGLIKAFQGETYGESNKDLIRSCKKKNIDIQKPFHLWTPSQQQWLIEGDCSDPEEAWRTGAWYGIQGFFKWLESNSYKMHVRVFLSRFRSYKTCPTCQGSRLHPRANHYKLHQKTIHELNQLSIDELLHFFNTLPITSKDKITLMLLEQVSSRLTYLHQAGLSYLTLSRLTRSLSGGELQRVNLTSCLGAALVNTLFVLDEPSIGLHPRDTQQLIHIMSRLTQRGNTLLVVEHDESIMRQANHIIEIGPDRGAQGGQLVFQGTLPEFKKSKTKSLTADYLFGHKTLLHPRKRRLFDKDKQISLANATCHNIKNLSVHFPLHLFCTITGVSGSGKSTLIHQILYKKILETKQEEVTFESSAIADIEGLDLFREALLVDQTPLSKTPRSCVVIYLDAFDSIRDLFASTPAAVNAGLNFSSFSFNSKNGRCERCAGMGYEKVEMQFLSDVFVTCPDCNGKRYQQKVLDIQFNEKNIHDILSLTVSEAILWLDSLPHQQHLSISTSLLKKLHKSSQRLTWLEEAGLGYLTLGQPLNTLSGGEAQRLKLISHLLLTSNPTDYLFLLDEPTTGLHFDDIRILLNLLQKIVDMGNSIIVIEHNLDVIYASDWIIDMGPEGGHQGGLIIGQGTPEQLLTLPQSHTAQYLKKHLQTKSELQEKPSKIQEPISNEIQIRGAREHNLKNISVNIPRDQLVVISGLSGSGKSTLAFDLLFAEGQRRFLDSMNVYARAYVEQMEKPDVDLITGIPPTVAIEQRVSRGNSKSTVSTVTEVYHFLRLLFAKLGTQYCPNCDIPVMQQTTSSIVDQIIQLSKKESFYLCTPLIKGKKGNHTEVAESAAKRGIETLWVDGTLIPSINFKKLSRYQVHDIDAVISSVTPKINIADLSHQVQKALQLGNGVIHIRNTKNQFKVLNSQMSCPQCLLSFEPLDPRLFSFNNSHGWCPDCRGFGFQLTKNLKIEQDETKSILENELAYELAVINQECDTHHTTCPTCQGSRLNTQARYVKLPFQLTKSKSAINLPITQLHQYNSAELLNQLKHLQVPQHLNEVARDITAEITQRLSFMQEVGLAYLQLHRSADTLSGGEAQRIRLASQLGSNLSGVLYILDEPTIGLHPRDNEKLLDSLIQLKNKGNSLIVVEHDTDTLSRADHIIDLGPAAGKFGGQIIAEGNLKKLQKNPTSITGQQLKIKLKHPLRGQRRSLPSKNISSQWLSIAGASANNLKNIDIHIPIGRLAMITGVSGAGKSSLMHGVILPAVTQHLQKNPPPSSVKTWKSIQGTESFKAIHEVDQSPIGKTSRSCPATYVGLMDDIRQLYAQLPEAKTRGFDASRFSFNSGQGRCETCAGNGYIKIEMAFLPTSQVLCHDCQGMRYNSATLQIQYKGKSIGQVLQMNIDEAVDFFAEQPRLQGRLKMLAETGLGYLQLGQSSATLSGGEAQRLKLVTELSGGYQEKIKETLKAISFKKKNLYLIEEPSIGLHLSDVLKLIEVLHRLTDEGHTVVVIEHHMNLVAEADYIIDIGPEAGEAGGYIVDSGTPEKIATLRRSQTAPYLKAVL